MAEVSWIKIPTDVLECAPLKVIEGMPNSDRILTIYFKLLLDTYRTSREGIFTICKNPTIEITDGFLEAIVNKTDIKDEHDTLIKYGLIERYPCHLIVHKAWEDKRDRSTTAYKEWRTAVFERDNYKCTVCGTTKEIQAHHIKRWRDYKSLRYDVSNGVTLCRKHHLEAHKGRWNNG